VSAEKGVGGLEIVKTTFRRNPFEESNPRFVGLSNINPFGGATLSLELK
jgi:hypothetical protein